MNSLQFPATEEAGRRRRWRNLRIVAVGDIHGHFDVLDSHLQRVRQEWGDIDLVLSPGDTEALLSEEQIPMVHGPAKFRRLGSFPQVASGELALGAPLIFSGGNHEPYAAYDTGRTPRRLAAEVHYTGRAGNTHAAVLVERGEPLALRIAWLSGIYSRKVTHGRAQDRHSPRERSYYVEAELERVMRGPRPDILLTHDWPTGIGGVTKRGEPAGDPNLERLVRTLAPRLHICGHMHHRYSATLAGTRVEALGHVRAGTASLFCFELTPDGDVVDGHVPEIAELARDEGQKAWVAT